MPALTIADYQRATTLLNPAHLTMDQQGAIVESGMRLAGSAGAIAACVADAMFSPDAKLDTDAVVTALGDALFSASALCTALGGDLSAVLGESLRRRAEARDAVHDAEREAAPVRVHRPSCVRCGEVGELVGGDRESTAYRCKHGHEWTEPTTDAV